MTPARRFTDAELLGDPFVSPVAAQAIIELADISIAPLWIAHEMTTQECERAGCEAGHDAS